MTAYKSYLEGAITLVLGQYVTDDEAKALAAGLATHIYDGHLKEDKATLSATLSAYFTENFDVATLNNICVGVLSEKQMKSVIDEVLGDAYNDDEINALSLEELKAFFKQTVTTKDQLGSAITLCANDVAADLYGDIAENVFTTFGRVAISGAHSAFNSALGNYNNYYSKYIKALSAYNEKLEADGADADSTIKAKADLDKAEANLKEVKANAERAQMKVDLVHHDRGLPATA